MPTISSTRHQNTDANHQVLTGNRNFLYSGFFAGTCRATFFCVNLQGVVVFILFFITQHDGYALDEARQSLINIIDIDLRLICALISFAVRLNGDRWYLASDRLPVLNHPSKTSNPAKSLKQASHGATILTR